MEMQMDDPRSLEEGGLYQLLVLRNCSYSKISGAGKGPHPVSVVCP